MKTVWVFLCSIVVLTFVPTLAVATAPNAGDFSGGVTIGTSYAGANTAPTNGLIVQGNVGIGTTSPQSQFHILTTSSGGPRGAIVTQITSDADAAAFGSEKARGTAGSPAAVNNSDYIGSMNYAPYDGTNYFDTAGLGAIVNGTVATGSVPTDLFFYTGAVADDDPYTNGKVRMVISSAGNVGIGNTSPSYLLHVGSSSASGIVAELQNSSGACTHNPGASSETVSCSSDIRFKSDVQDSKNALAWLGDMHIRDFTVKATGERTTGVVAQEMLLTHPEMVHKDKKGFYSVDEPNPWKLVKAIQDQQEEIDSLKRMIEQLKKQR